MSETSDPEWDLENPPAAGKQDQQSDQSCTRDARTERSLCEQLSVVTSAVLVALGVIWCVFIVSSQYDYEGSVTEEILDDSGEPEPEPPDSIPEEGEAPAIPLTVEDCEMRLGEPLENLGFQTLSSYIRGTHTRPFFRSPGWSDDHKDKPLTKEFAERLTRDQWSHFTRTYYSQHQCSPDISIHRLSWCLSVVRLRPSLGRSLWDQVVEDWSQSDWAGSDLYLRIRTALVKPSFLEELVSHVRETCDTGCAVIVEHLPDSDVKCRLAAALGNAWLALAGELTECG